jgi:hypothetical protein
MPSLNECAIIQQRLRGCLQIQIPTTGLWKAAGKMPAPRGPGILPGAIAIQFLD